MRDAAVHHRAGPVLDRALADGVLVLHLAFILFVVAGGLLGVFWRWTPIVHLPAALWGAFIELSGGICPLTPLENSLRRAAGSAGYTGSFVDHYLLPVVYPAGLTESTQWLLGVGVVLVNGLVYGFVWRVRRRRRPARPGEPGASRERP